MTKDELFAAYDCGMRFPSYFGSNWDAFDECIRDRSWISNPRVLVVHSDLPLSNKPEEQVIYLELLIDAVLDRRVQQGAHIPPAPKLIVLFPADCLKKIDEVPESSEHT